VIVGSVAGIRNTPGNLYSVTKWAVHALAENVRLLVAKDGVGVTLVAPGVVNTRFWEERGGRPEEVPVLTAEQVASTIGFAISQPEGVDVNHLVVRPAGKLGLSSRLTPLYCLGRREMAAWPCRDGSRVRLLALCRLPAMPRFAPVWALPFSGLPGSARRSKVIADSHPPGSDAVGELRARGRAGCRPPGLAADAQPVPGVQRAAAGIGALR